MLNKSPRENYINSLFFINITKIHIRKNYTKLSGKNKSKKGLFNSYFIFFLLIYLFLSIPQLYSSKKIELRKLNYDNFIIITVVNADWHRILSEEASDDILPNKLKINNDNEIDNNIQRDYELFEETNTIKMTWNSPLTSCKNLFKKTAHIISIDLSNFDFSSLTDMGSFFEECWQVQSIDMSNGNAVNVENMDWMFKYCDELLSIDFTNFKTGSLKSMAGTFFHCGKLQYLELGSFKTNDVTSMYQLFTECFALKSLDLSNFHTPALTDMNEMFRDCKSLEYLNLNNFDTTYVTNMNLLFQENHSLKSLDLSNFYTPSLTSMEKMFMHCYSLESLDIKNFNTEKIQFMGNLFEDCQSLKYLDLSNFDTSSVTEMANMFMNCYELTSIEINSFDTSKLTNMGHMFSECRSLKSLDLSDFRTGTVEWIDHMFYDCYSLEYLNIINFNTENIYSYVNMFFNTSSLISLNLTNFKVVEETNVTDIIKDIKPDVILCYNESQVTEDFKNEVSGHENDCKKVCDLRLMIYIDEIDKCVDNCYHSGTEYIYEYEHKCYKECPPRTKFYFDSEICEDCRDFYNYENTGCWDSVPDGYYNDNVSAKTVKKCQSECKKCSLHSVNNNLCISCNDIEEYYYKEDDSLNTVSYYKCYHKNEVQVDYYLDNDIFKRCYSKCITMIFMN